MREVRGEGGGEGTHTAALINGFKPTCAALSISSLSCVSRSWVSCSWVSSAALIPADLRSSPTSSPRVLLVAETLCSANSSNEARVPRVLLVGSLVGGRARVLLADVGTGLANILANPAMASE